MSNEIQFPLYNMPDAEGSVQVVIKDAPTTHDFYAMIQNRFHYAITGHTAAEIIYSKSDHTKENMGLTTWKYAAVLGKRK